MKGDADEGCQHENGQGPQENHRWLLLVIEIFSFLDEVPYDGHGRKQRDPFPFSPEREGLFDEADRSGQQDRHKQATGPGLMIRKQEQASEPVYFSARLVEDEVHHLWVEGKQTVLFSHIKYVSI